MYKSSLTGCFLRLSETLLKALRWEKASVPIWLWYYNQKEKKETQKPLEAVRPEDSAN